MTEPSARPTDRLAIGLALTTLLIVNLAVVSHFTKIGGPLVVKAFLGLAFLTGGLAWFRLKKTSL